MIRRLRPAKTRERRATVLAGLILLQALCALFFIGDVIQDFREDGHLDNPHLLLESVAAVALIAGVIFLMIELRGLLSRMSDMQTGLEIAHGHLAEVIQGFFEGSGQRHHSAGSKHGARHCSCTSDQHLCEIGNRRTGTIHQPFRGRVTGGGHGLREWIGFRIDEPTAEPATEKTSNSLTDVTEQRTSQ